eukprot:gene31196-39160_t
MADQADPVQPVMDTTLLDSLESFYALSKDFPFRRQLITRTPDTARPKRLYYISSGVRKLLATDAKCQLN